MRHTELLKKKKGTTRCMNFDKNFDPKTQELILLSLVRAKSNTLLAAAVLCMYNDMTVCLFIVGLVYLLFCNIRSPDIETVSYKPCPCLRPIQQCCRPDVTESYGAHGHSKVTDDETECFWQVSIIRSKRHKGMLSLVKFPTYGWE